MSLAVLPLRPVLPRPPLPAPCVGSASLGELGWDDAPWDALELDLILRLTPICDRLRTLLPDEDMRDEYIAYLITSFYRQAERGTLFPPDVDAWPDPAGRLIVPSFVRLRAITFLRDGRKRRHGELDPDKGTADASACRRRSDELVQGIGRALEAMRLEPDPSAPANRITQTAFLQLFPRLNASSFALAPIQAVIEADIAVNALPGAPPLDLLQKLHEQAKKRLEGERTRKLKELDNDGKGVTPKDRRDIEAALDVLAFDETFQPLSVSDLVELLGISAADAAARRMRYRRALPQMLPELCQLWNDWS